MVVSRALLFGISQVAVAQKTPCFASLGGDGAIELVNLAEDACCGCYNRSTGVPTITEVNIGRPTAISPSEPSRDLSNAVSPSRPDWLGALLGGDET